MDLMALVPNHFITAPSLERMPTIVHNCEVPKEKDELERFVEGKSRLSNLRRWLLGKRIVSRKHPLARWCLKSTTEVNYEITRHLRSYPRMIHPLSSFRVLWESVITIFTIAALLVSPVLLAFHLDAHKDWHFLDNIIDAVFISDVAVWFFTGYYDYHTKAIVLDPRIVATKYLRGYFVIDVLPVLPLEFLEDIVPRSAWYVCASLNMLKILKIRIVVTYGRRLRYVYRMNFQLYKILEIGVIIIICVHWAACFEYYVPIAVAKLFGANDESWVHSPYLEKKETNLEKYFICVNRATTALVCSAHYLDMKTPEDIILNLILTLIGSLGFTYLLGRHEMTHICNKILAKLKAQFLQLMTTFHSTSKRRSKLIQQLQEYMRHKELPQSLQRRLLIYYNYRNKKGLERDKQIINSVSPYLREELILHSYFRFVNSVELFRHLPQTLVARLATALRSQIFMTNDVIVKAGTRGDALYFIAAGTVAVYTSDKEVCHLEDGAYFGEIALVMESEYRIATVIAIETSDVYILFRNDFQRIIAPYPDILNRLQNVALEHLERTILLEEAYNLKSSISASYINISTIKPKKKD